MSSIVKIDPNMAPTAAKAEGLVWHDVRRAPFVLYGQERDESGEKFCRIPRELAKVNDGVRVLNEYTAGIRVRFLTDSPYVALCGTTPGVVWMSNMCVIGSSGYDLYADGEFVGVYRPDFNVKDRVEGILTFDEKKEREIEINFPLYCAVDSLYIGLKEGSFTAPPKPYRHEKPVLFYGSSITEGGCACRPGLSYQAHICRDLGTDYRNLGFSGSAKGESAMAEYIAAQEMSVFVMDYDHNAPNPEHLEKTHEPFYRIIREKNPTLPIVIVTRPDMVIARPSTVRDSERRREIVYRTYKNAKAAGDENVYFIDGSRFYPDELREFCTVDGCHPNDMGFYFMAQGIEKVLRPLLGEEKALPRPSLPLPAIKEANK